MAWVIQHAKKHPTLKRRTRNSSAFFSPASPGFLDLESGDAPTRESVRNADLTCATLGHRLDTLELGKAECAIPRAFGRDRVLACAESPRSPERCTSCLQPYKSME